VREEGNKNKNKKPAEIKGGYWEAEVIRKHFRQRKEHKQVWRGKKDTGLVTPPKKDTGAGCGSSQLQS
jgi:hypothetical protein